MNPRLKPYLQYECFANQAAFEEHAAKPYVRAFLYKADELCAEPRDIKFLERIEQRGFVIVTILT
jgi:quinol monooxygenase YgiN